MFNELLAKIQFWRAKNLKLGEDYDFFLDLSNHEALAIKILKKYPGVIIEYTNIHMSTDTNMSYDLTVIANPNLHDTDSKKFQDFTMKIFRSILLGSIEHIEKDKNENRNTDTVESDSERTVYEEESAIPQERISKRKPRKKTVRRNKAVHS